MTDLFRPVFAPLTTAVDEAIDIATSSFVTASPLLVAGARAADPVRLAQILEALTADAARTLNARSHDEFCDALQAWGDDLVDLAAIVLLPVAAAGAVGAELGQALAVEVLRVKFPRLAAMLSLAGVIVDDPGIGSRFDREKLRDFMLSTPELVDETFWDDVFGADGATSGRMPALLAALLIVAPQTIQALGSGDLRLAPLLPPPTSPDADAGWRDLRARSTGWVPITLPLKQGTGGLEIADFPDLRGSFDPELALSLLIRSQRRPVGGRTVTDFEMWFHPSEDAASYEIPTSPDVVARLEPGVRVGVGYDGGTGKWNAAIEPRAGSPVAATTNEAILHIGRDSAPGEPDLILGPPYDTRIVARDMNLDLRMRERGEPSVEVIGRVDGFGVVLTNRWFRSLGESASALREGVRLDMDFEARLTEGAGFSFSADGALTTRWQIDKEFKPKFLKIKIHSILFNVPVRADQDHFDIRAEVRPHWSAKIGPVTVVMDGAGAWLGWWADEPGDPKECIGLLRPTGIGLQLEGPGFSGGGFVDFTGGPNDRYGGLLTLTVGQPNSLSRWGVTAFGLHELTGSPNDTERGRTFVLVIGASFRPGYHIAYGIYWIGAGGIVGIHRRADTDALRERLTAGAVGNILFAEDPVRNAPVLLGDLAALFPPKADRYVFGLTMQLGWIPIMGIPADPEEDPVSEYLVRLAIGVIVEFDADIRPTKVIVLGSLRIAIPKFEKFLDIQVDTVGIFDVERRTLEVDATIRRGVVLRVFTVTGDGGVRASWGDSRYLMATLGGFHPDFHPEPAVFPTLRRILLTVDKDLLPESVELSAAAYFAITSNTIQFGAKLTAAIKAGNWKIEGTIAGDALIRLPFYFDVSLSGGVHVKYRGHSLFGVDFSGGLSGPSPLVLRGKVCVSLLLFDACWSDSFQLADPGEIAGSVITSLVSVLAGELTLPANLAVAEADDGLVLLRRLEDGTARVVLSPLGAPTWRQNRMPLGLPIERFEDDKLDAPQRLDVRATVPTSAHEDWFSPGSFIELTEAEAMALPSFERHQAGVVASFDETRSAGVTVDIEFQEIRLPNTSKIVDGIVVPHDVLERMNAVGAPPSIRPRPPRFEVFDDRFLVEAPNGDVLATDVSAVTAHLAGRTRRAATQHVADRRVEVAV